MIVGGIVNYFCPGKLLSTSMVASVNVGSEAEVETFWPRGGGGGEGAERRLRHVYASTHMAAFNLWHFAPKSILKAQLYYTNA